VPIIPIEIPMGKHEAPQVIDIHVTEEIATEELTVHTKHESNTHHSHHHTHKTRQ